MKLMFIMGTRPEAIKLAPIIELARLRPGCAVTVVSTGQHKEMLEQACRALGVAVDVDLSLMDHCRNLCDTAGMAIQKMGRLIEERQPDWIIVQGDTSTAMAAGLAGFYMRCRIAHVEAGLRSFDNDHPFPEEVNRRIISTFADWHFAPTAQARDNLVAEGIAADKIVVTGNTVIDALIGVQKKINGGGPVRDEIQAELPPLDFGRPVVLVTSHRRENHEAGLSGICAAILRLAREHPGAQFVFPVHLNPAVSGPVTKALRGVDNIYLTAPLSYFALVELMSRSRLIMTDSGGIQEEASAFSTPVLVLREKTERMEGVEAGIARLVGTDTDTIYAQARALLLDEECHARMSVPAMPYGDGQAALRIMDIIAPVLPAHAGIPEAGNDTAAPQEETECPSEKSAA